MKIVYPFLPISVGQDICNRQLCVCHLMSRWINWNLWLWHDRMRIDSRGLCLNAFLACPPCVLLLCSSPLVKQTTVQLWVESCLFSCLIDPKQTANCTSVLLTRWIKFSTGSKSITVRKQQAPKKKMVAGGAGGGADAIANLWEKASQSHNMSTLYACSLNRWALQQDTAGNWSNFQKASEAQHKEWGRVGEEDKEMLERLSFHHCHGYLPKKISRKHCYSLNSASCLNLTLALDLCEIG